MDAMLLRMQGILTQFPVKLSRGTVTGPPVILVSQKLLTGVDKGLHRRSLQTSNLEGVTPKDTQSRHSLPVLVKFERLYFQEF